MSIDLEEEIEKARKDMEKAEDSLAEKGFLSSNGCS
jgi:hypothetical protein